VVLYNVTSLYKVFAILDFRTTVVTIEVTDIYLFGSNDTNPVFFISR
jgi:hypothetical protein